MTLRHLVLIGSATTLLAACSAAETGSEASSQAVSPFAATAIAPLMPAITEGSFYADAPAGVYEIEKGHAYIAFTYTHAGYSRPFLRWKDWDSAITWDPENPENSSVNVSIAVAGIDSGVDVFDEHLVSSDWFDAEAFPTITFQSTSVEKTTDSTGKITGNLTIRDNTKPITLDVVFNKTDYDRRHQGQKMGFSARGQLLRSDFGVGKYAPGVGDEVDLIIETEYVMKMDPQE